MKVFGRSLRNLVDLSVPSSKMFSVIPESDRWVVGRGLNYLLLARTEKRIHIQLVDCIILIE